MRVLFLQDNGLNESIPVTEIAGYLRHHGHGCGLLLERNEKNFYGKILEFKPGLVIVPWDVGANAWVRPLAAHLKKHVSAPVVFCGSFPTLKPQVICEENVDLVCQGECEEALLDIIRAVEAGKDFSRIPNLGVKVYPVRSPVARDAASNEVFINPIRPAINPLDKLSLPDRGIYFDRYPFMAKLSLKRFVSGRGCPYTCSFCYNERMKKDYSGKGPFVRKKSVQRILEEIAEVEKNYGLQSIHFSDDQFTVNRAWTLEFCGEYARRFRYPYTFNTTADVLDEELVRALKASGCRGVMMGVETGNEELRRKRLNKYVKDEHFIKAGELLKRYNILFTASNVIGYPGETLEIAMETIRFNRKIAPDNPRVFVYYPMPRLALTQKAKEMGLLEDGYEDRPDAKVMTPLFESLSNAEIENYVNFFHVLVKLPVSDRWTRRLLRLPRLPFLKLLLALRFLGERKFFNITWLSGLRFMLHTTSPLGRTKNINTIVP